MIPNEHIVKKKSFKHILLKLKDIVCVISIIIGALCKIKLICETQQALYRHPIPVLDSLLRSLLSGNKHIKIFFGQRDSKLINHIYLYHLFSLESKLMMFQNYLWIALYSNKMFVSWFSGWTKSWPQQVHFWKANSSQVSSFKGNFVPFILFCNSITALSEF